MRLKILDMPPASQERYLNNAPPALYRGPHSSNPCGSCGGHCCQLMVALTTVEAFRMASAMSLAIEAFAEAVVVPPALLATFRVPKIPLAQGPTVIRLRRHPETMLCNFLMNVSGAGRCGVYSLRPHTCRLYPYNLEIDGELLKTGSQNLCPTRWLQTDSAIQPVAATVRQMRVDHRAEERLHKAWLKAGGQARSWEEYLAFVTEKLKTHFPLPAPPPAPRARKMGAAWWKPA